MGMDKPIVTDSERMRPEQSEVLKLVSDNSLARRVLGWEPKVGVDDGLRQMIDFVRTNPGFYKTDRYVT